MLLVRITTDRVIATSRLLVALIVAVAIAANHAAMSGDIKAVGPNYLLEGTATEAARAKKLALQRYAMVRAIDNKVGFDPIASFGGDYFRAGYFPVGRSDTFYCLQECDWLKPDNNQLQCYGYRDGRLRCLFTVDLIPTMHLRVARIHSLMDLLKSVYNFRLPQSAPSVVKKDLAVSQNYAEYAYEGANDSMAVTLISALKPGGNVSTENSTTFYCPIHDTDQGYVYILGPFYDKYGLPLPDGEMAEMDAKPTESPIVLSIFTDQSGYVVGEPINLYFPITNSTHKVIYMSDLCRAVPFGWSEDQGNVMVSCRNARTGKQVAWIPPASIELADMLHEQTDAIPAGTSKGSPYDISECFKLSPGKYVLAAQYETANVQNWIEKDPNAWHGYSNIARSTITVKQK